MAFVLHHTPSAFERALSERYRHAARWLRAAVLMNEEERPLAQAMQTPLAVIKPANTRRR